MVEYVDHDSCNDIFEIARHERKMGVEQAGNTFLQTEVLETLPEQVEVVVDLHLRPYYGDEDVLVELAEETGLGGNEIRRAIGDEAILDRLQEEFSKPNGRASPVSPR